MCKVRAWCKVGDYENRLSDHLFNTLRVALEIERLRSTLRAAALKVSLPFEKEFREKIAEKALTLSLYSITAHDLGKACSKFQETVRYSGDKCEARFYNHEIISSAIAYEAVYRKIYLEVAKILDEIREKAEQLSPQEESTLEELKGLPFTALYAVISHHQAMEDRGLSELDREPNNVSENIIELCGELLIDELLNELNDLNLKIGSLINSEKDPLFREALHNLSSWIEGTKNMAKGLKDARVLKERLIGMLRCLREPSCDINSKGNPHILQHAYVTTGILMIADNLTALCEREGLGGFGKRLWLEISGSEEIKDLCIGLGIKKS